MGKLSVKTVTPLCLKSSMGKLIDSVLKIYRHDDLKWHYSCSTDRVNFRVELLTMVFIVTKCESKKVAQLFQKVTWIISWHQFLHKLFFFKLAQKSTIFYGLLFAILLPRTLKNHPIRSHCSHDLKNRLSYLCKVLTRWQIFLVLHKIFWWREDKVAISFPRQNVFGNIC